MTFQEVTMWMVACDCCGEKAEYGDYAAWLDQGMAIEKAEGFKQIGDEHLCGACWCWPEDLPDYPGDEAWEGGDEAWEGGDDEVRAHERHPDSPISATEEQR